jgi:endonuclease YncB( thermonuclease family)
MKLFQGVPTFQKVMMLGVFGAVATYSLSQQKERVEQITSLKLSDANPRVVDGDTVDVKGSRVRIVGIDAPDEDLPQLKGIASEALRELAARDGGLNCSTNVFDFALRREKQCRTDAESYGRLNLACRFRNNDASVAATMVAQGYAVDYRRFSGGAYVDLMKKAADQRLGLWAVDYEGMRSLAQRQAAVPKSCQVDTIKK